MPQWVHWKITTKDQRIGGWPKDARVQQGCWPAKNGAGGKGEPSDNTPPEKASFLRWQILSQNPHTGESTGGKGLTG